MSFAGLAEVGFKDSFKGYQFVSSSICMYALLVCFISNSGCCVMKINRLGQCVAQVLAGEYIEFVQMLSCFICLYFLFIFVHFCCLQMKFLTLENCSPFSWS